MALIFLYFSAGQEDEFLAPNPHVHHIMWRKFVVDAVGVQEVFKVSAGGLGLEEGYQGDEQGSAEPEHHVGGGGGRPEPSGICEWQ